MLTLFDEAKLTDIPEFDDLIASAEGLGVYVPTPTLVDDGDKTIDRSQKVQSPNLVNYTISTLPSGNGKMISFYLNVLNLVAQCVNQFVLLCDCLITPNDILRVHLPDVLYIEESETIANAIRDCRARFKVASVPYTLNTAAFYPSIACDYMLSSSYGYAHFDVPSLRTGGPIKDAHNSFEYDKTRKLRLITDLNSEGFILNSELEYILKKQGSISIFGEELQKRMNQFNLRHSNKKLSKSE